MAKNPEKEETVSGGTSVYKGYGIGKIHVFANRDDILNAKPEESGSSPDFDARLDELLDGVSNDFKQTKKTLEKNGTWDDSPGSVHSVIDIAILTLDMDRKSIKEQPLGEIEGAGKKNANVHDALKKSYDKMTALGKFGEVPSEIYLRMMAINSGLECENTETIKAGSILVAGPLGIQASLEIIEKDIAGVISSDGPLTHFVMLCRDKGIPCIAEVDIQDIMSNPEQYEGTQAVVDSYHGQMTVNPEKETLAQYKKLQKQEAARKEELKKHALEPCVTKDGHPVPILANKNDLNFEPVKSLPVDGVGLVRLEAIYAKHAQDQTPLDSAALSGMFTDACCHLGSDRPVTIRLLDVNEGDKTVEDLLSGYQRDAAVKEDEKGNLLKGAAFLLANPGLMETQMKAILKTESPQHKKILIPYIQDPKEVTASAEILQSSIDDLKDEMPQVGRPSLCSMVETTALTHHKKKLKEVIKLSDEISIGGNDLSNEEANVDRYNASESKSKYAPIFHPNFIKAVNETGEICKKEDTACSMCGDCASDLDFLPLLIAMDIKPVVLGDMTYDIRERAKHLDRSECQELLADVLEMKSSKGVHDKLMAFSEKHFPEAQPDTPDSTPT